MDIHDWARIKKADIDKWKGNNQNNPVWREPDRMLLLYIKLYIPGVTENMRRAYFCTSYMRPNA